MDVLYAMPAFDYNLMSEQFADEAYNATVVRLILIGYCTILALYEIKVIR